MLKFYRCEKCGNFVIFLHKAQPTPVCCGDPMTEIVPDSVDAAKEKHVPVIKADGSQIKVHVGSVDHPMEEKHYIEFIILETNQGFQKKNLKPGDAPEAAFALAEGEKALRAYAYCNLHGMWVTEA